MAALVLDLMVKDLTIAMEIAKETGTPGALATPPRDMGGLRRRCLAPATSTPETAKLSETMAGTELR